MTVDIDSKKTVNSRPKKKPPTQTTGVFGIDAHGPMGSKPVEPYINWGALTKLPAFEMFVQEQSGQAAGASAANWVVARRVSLGDEVLYRHYAEWHDSKGLWPCESPSGNLLQEGI